MDLPSTNFSELLTGLIEVMGADTLDPQALEHAGDALTYIVVYDPLRKHIMSETSGNLEHLLAGLTQVPPEHRLLLKLCRLQLVFKPSRRCTDSFGN